jgi:hypothetical protein
MSELLDNVIPKEERNTRFKEQRAIENNVSLARSAAELGEAADLEKAVRLTKRAVSAARNAGLNVDTAAVEATLREIQARGYKTCVARLVDRIQKRAAKGDLAEVEACVQLVATCVEKAKEFGEVITLDEELIGQAVVRAEEMGKQNVQRDAVIAAHMKQMGDAFVSLYDAFSQAKSGTTGDKSGK